MFLVIVHQVLEALRRHKLYLHSEKRSFEKETVGYLGTIVGKGEVHMAPAKVDMVTGWLVPKCKCDVQSFFLGVCNVYQHLIQGFSAITCPWTRLTGSISWAQEEERQKAFG